MTLPRLYALNEYWVDHPPVHIMVAAYLGIKPKAKIDNQSGDMLAELLSAGLQMG